MTHPGQQLITTWDQYGGMKYYRFCTFSPKQDGNMVWGWLYPLPTGRFQFVEVKGVSSEFDFIDKSGPQESIHIFANKNRLRFVPATEPTTVETYLGFYYFDPATKRLSLNKSNATQFCFPSASYQQSLYTYQYSVFTTAPDEANVEDISDYDAATSTVGLQLYDSNDAHWNQTNFAYQTYFANYAEPTCGVLSPDVCPPNKCTYIKFGPNTCGGSSLFAGMSPSTKKWFWRILLVLLVFIIFYVMVVRKR